MAAQPVGESLGHCGDGGAAVGAEHGRAAAGVVQGDFLGRDVARGKLAARGNINKARTQAARGNDVADEAQLRALGVERPDDKHDGWSGRLGSAQFASLPRGLFNARDPGREHAGGRFDARDRRRL